MFPVIAIILANLILGRVDATQPQCALSGTSAWSNQLRQIVPDCELTITAPDGRIRLRIDAKGDIHASMQSGEPLEGQALKVTPPGDLSWSPSSNAFFINDGEGSGESSPFRLFRITGRRIVEDTTVHETAVAQFRARKKCGSKNEDQSAWGIGWSPDGAQVYLFVQDGPHDPCASPGGFFIAWVVRVADCALVERVNEAAAKRRFRSLLPPELFVRK